MKPGQRAQLILPAILLFLNQATFAQDISTVVSGTQLPAPYAVATIPFTGIAPAVPVVPRKTVPGMVTLPAQKQIMSKPSGRFCSAGVQVSRVGTGVKIPLKATAAAISTSRFGKGCKRISVPQSEAKRTQASTGKSTQAVVKGSENASGKTTAKSTERPAGAVEFLDPLTNISTEVITKAQAVPNNPEAKTVALTFDDGPSPVYTRQVLAILKENQIHATFCVVGRQVKLCPDLVRQIVAEGHKIANHSMNHDESIARKANKKIKTEVLAENELILSCAPDAKIEYFRAPAGNWNMKLRKMSASWGMKALGWSIDTKDWQHPGADAIVNHVTKYLHSRGVVLMHDGGGDRSESVAALKRIIPLLKADGYEFTFPE